MSTLMADRISDLWSEERCTWRLDFDGGAGTVWPWTVWLEWTTDRDAPHGASWACYTWEFYGESVEVAIAGAMGWIESLLPWAVCQECMGEKTYVAKGGAVRDCDDCGGTGLANRGQA